MVFAAGGVLRACLLCMILLAQQAYAAALPVALRCAGSESFAQMRAAEGWKSYDDGRIVVTPQQPVCWIRLAPSASTGAHLLFSGSWVDVAVFSADGAPLAATRRAGADGGKPVTSLRTSQHMLVPAAAGALHYARISLLPGWGMAAEASVEAGDATALFAASQRREERDLAIVAILLTSALFLGIFALVLRYLNYALLAGFLLLTGCARLVEHGQLLSLLPYGPATWPLWAATWPLANAALALTSSALGRFALHAPAAHRASLGMALLFLPLCLAWPAYPALSDQINAVLNVPLYAVLVTASAIGARRGDSACRVLLVANLLGAATSLWIRRWRTAWKWRRIWPFHCCCVRHWRAASSSCNAAAPPCRWLPWTVPAVMP